MFENIDRDEIRDFNLDFPFTDTYVRFREPPDPVLTRPPACRQAGFIYDQQILIEFRLYQWILRKSLQIDFLPSSVQIIGVENCYQEFALHCRRLPRDALRVYLPGNRIFGTLDLEKLPVKIVAFDVCRNNLYGGFSLVDLPERLEVLRVDGNKGVGQDIVLYRNIPNGLRESACAMSRSSGQQKNSTE